MRFTTRDQLKSGVDAPVRDIDGLNALRVPNAPKAPDAFNRGPEVWTHDLFDRQIISNRGRSTPTNVRARSLASRNSTVRRMYDSAATQSASDAIREAVLGTM